MNRLVKVLLLLLLSLYAVGCAQKEVAMERVLFPPPPAEPRFEWINTVTSKADLSNEETRFDEFLLG